MALNLAEPIARLLLRLFLGSAVELQAERSGLVAIPEELRQFAGLQDELVLVGQGDYFEIWAPELWGKQEAQLRDADANSSRFAALPMATH
jgi:MraZ protein